MRQFYDGMLARVQNNGEFSNQFPVTNGAKQNCVLATKLFSIMFSINLQMLFRIVAMVYLLGFALMGSFSTYEGCKLNQRCRQMCKYKVQTEVLDDFLFADNMAKGAPTEEKMQKGVDQISDLCDRYDLTISIKKNEVVYQPARRKSYKEPTHTVKGQRLQVVDTFTYVGITLSRVVHIDDEVNARIAKASTVFEDAFGIEVESDLTQS